MKATHDFLFVGFASQVVALRKTDGKIQWKWKAPKGRGYAVVLVEDETAFVSINGYTYALEAATGKQLWFNQLEGLGMGVPTLATARQSVGLARLASDDEDDSAPSTAVVST